MAQASRLAEICHRHSAHHLFARAVSENWSTTQLETECLRLARYRYSGGLQLSRLLAAVEANPKAPRFDADDRDALERFAAERDEAYDPKRWFLPWSELARALGTTATETIAITDPAINTDTGNPNITVASPSGGKFVGAPGTPLVAYLLAPFSIVSQLGVSVLDGITGTPILPVESSETTTITWQTDEYSMPGSASDPTVSGIAITSKHAYGVVKWSRRLRLQASTSIESFVRQVLLRVAGKIVDTAALAGSGLNGEPLGLLNVSGIHTQSGTGFSFASAQAMRDQVATQNAQDIRWLGAVDTRTLLENRVRFLGTASPLWENGAMLGLPAFAATTVPNDALICGHWPSLAVCLYGPGITIDLNPYGAGFSAGGIEARVAVDIDVALLNKDAFSISTSIT